MVSQPASDSATTTTDTTTAANTTTAPTSTVRAPTSTTPSVDELFALTDRTLRAGGLYHRTGTVVADVVGHSEQTVEVWADATRDAARVDTTYTNEQPERSTVELAVDGADWTVGEPLPPTKAWTCAGAGHATAIVLECPRPQLITSMSVEAATDQGRRALVLVITGKSVGSDETITFTRRVVIDPATGLPWSMSETGTYETNTVSLTSTTASYTGEFVDSSTQPTDLFDPAALGVVTDPGAQLPMDVRVDWLGPQFDPGHGLPPLVFAQVEPGGVTGPGYAAILLYSTPDRFGDRVIAIEVWARTKYEQSGFPQHPCPEAPSFTVAVGEATFQCFGADTTTVFVENTDTVAIVHAPQTQRATGEVINPYANREAMTLIAQGLQARVS